MSKSYRKPYAAVTGVRSAAHDKMVARRCWRRAQEHSLRTFQGDWEDLVLPERYEASYNDVWGWGRDGIQRYRTLDHNDFNLHHRMPSYWSEEKRIEWHEKSLARQMQWIAELKRK